MKRIIIFFMLIFAVTIFTASCGNHLETRDINIYFPDKNTMTLTPVQTTITAASPHEAAEAILNSLIAGHDDNPDILRLIPKTENCMTVRVDGSIAYVDITQAMIDNHPDDYDSEMLTVYSIVNSLTNVNSIVNVRFTINGEKQKNFKGNIDMRETFIPDYCV